MSSSLAADRCSLFVLALCHFLWQGMLIAAVTSLALRTIHSVSARYWLGVGMLLLMAVCPLGTYGWLVQSTNCDSLAATGRIGKPPVSATAGISADFRSPAWRLNHVVTEPSKSPDKLQPPIAPGRSRSAFDSIVQSYTRTISEFSAWWRMLERLLMVVYVISVSAMLLRLLVALWCGHQLARQATAIMDTSLLDAFRNRATVLGMRHVPLLAYCEQVTVPTVMGVIRPMILLPLAMTSSLSPEQIESVLAHELSHVQRYDHLVNLCQRVIESFLFFHPGVWWISRQIRDLREHSCDDLVIASGFVPLDYANSLLCAAELSQLADTQGNRRMWQSSAVASLLATGDRPSTLRQRVARLLGCQSDNNVRAVSLVLLAVSCLFCLVAGATLTSITRIVIAQSDRSTESPHRKELPDEGNGGFADAADADHMDHESSDPTPAPRDDSRKSDQQQSVKSNQEDMPPNAINDTPGIHETKESLAEVLSSIRIEGNATIPNSEIAKHIKLRPGRPVTQEQIKADVDALMRTRWFATVEPSIRRTDEGNILVFRVLERPIVRKVEYRGNKKIKQKVFDNMTQLKPGSPYDVSANRECARRIQEYYREKGYPFATVELERGDVRGDPDREVIFVIDEGPKVKVTKLTFDGNKAFSDQLPGTKTQSKTRILYYFSGKYDPSSVNDDMEKIRDYYHSLGYFDVKITADKRFSEGKSTVVVHYDVEEGVRYRINHISFVGNTLISDGEIRKLLTLKDGEEYNSRNIDKDRKAVLSKYGEQGRPNSSVTPIPRWSEEPGVLDLVYKIDEDEGFRVHDAADAAADAQRPDQVEPPATQVKQRP